MKILLVEDDKLSAAALTEMIAASCYTVDIATDGQIGLRLATSWDYDLILLDLLIPKLDGISLCRQLRERGYTKPILLLTAKGSSADVVQGLDAGADDYVTKPYNLPELLARMRALLRRGETSLAPSIFTWEHLCINPISAEVTYRGEVVQLTSKEYGILVFFMRHPQRVFSRSDIIDRLWSIDASPSEGAVTNLIKDLRQKLKAAGMSEDPLETVYGLGYRLKPPPTRIATPSLQSAAPQPASNSPENRKKSPASVNPASVNTASINKVLKRYQNTFVERVAVLEQVVTQTSPLSQAQQQDIAQEAHKLAGALGSFGYETGSELARTIEHLLISDRSDISQLPGLIADLKYQVSQAPQTLTPSPSHPVETPVVLAIHQDAAFISELKQHSLTWGLQVQIVPDLAATSAQIQKQPAAAVLLNLPGKIDAELETLMHFRQQFPELPIVVMTGQDSLADRVRVSRLGVQRFLQYPVTAGEALQAIAQILPQASTSARVLILDDDSLILESLRSLLQPWGLQVTTLQDPQQFWTVLNATRPNLLVMDLEMPTFNGIDLCRVVRQDAQWNNLPILVVTAHADMDSIQQVFAAGADDFISKPIVGTELVTRVISRIDRSRLQQALETRQWRVNPGC